MVAVWFMVYNVSVRKCNHWIGKSFRAQWHCLVSLWGELRFKFTLIPTYCNNWIIKKKKMWALNLLNYSGYQFLKTLYLCPYSIDHAPWRLWMVECLRCAWVSFCPMLAAIQMMILVNSCRMKSIRDWVFSQLVSKSLVSSRPLSGSDSFFNEGRLDEENDDQGITLSASSFLYVQVWFFS